MGKVLCIILLNLALIACSPTTASLRSGQFDSAQTQSVGNPSVKVWVNTKSGVYHCPGTRWYGNTRSGEYMTQKQAQEKGYRPAYGKACE
jgi:hypothetical protein